MCIVYILVDHAVHGGVRRHGAADLAGEVHRLLLRPARDLLLRAARRENHLHYLIHLFNQCLYCLLNMLCYR